MFNRSPRSRSGLSRWSWGRAWRICAILTPPIFTPGAARAQQPPDLQQVLTRLDRLENQNRELIDELRALRQQIGAAQPSVPAPSQGPEPPASAQAAPPLPV